MGLRISLKEAYRRIRKARTFADIENLFKDAFDLSDVMLRGTNWIQYLPGAEAPLDIAEAARMANPYYAKGGSYATNCQRCAPAYELLRRGIRVVALPNLYTGRTGTSKRPNMNGSECFIGAIIHGYLRDSEWPLDRKQLLRALNLLPNGARTAIFWATPNADSGHVIVCEKSGGELVFIDPQSGRIGSHVLSEPNRENGYYWYRTDNLELNGAFEWNEIISAHQ